MRLLGFVAVVFFSGGIIGTAHAVPSFTDLNATTPEALVSDLLASNSGITVNSVLYNGANIASGLFTNGNSSNIGFDRGVALTTGAVGSLATDANVNNVALGNPILENFNGGFPTTNASTMTIEFTPIGNQITFSYVFASREYPDFVNSFFNDVFVFLVNGQNRALVPSTTTPVGINTVNCGDTFGNDPSNCDLFRDNRNGDISDLDLGGFTQVFDLVADVTPGVINTLVLSIGDTFDPFFDSAVFLESGTFRSCGLGQPACDNGGPPPGEVPEPGMIGLLGLGAVAVVTLRRRQSRRP
ncbi:MAG TPA: choice-of-anchor L domain-containing protein [Pedomonas sp.]|uniref:choice-of-anchor L family PEP-CTERM protein n=1 Tax=Pedomonas sp. TaxID=2976421 RepID=UPI002F3E76C9